MRNSTSIRSALTLSLLSSLLIACGGGGGSSSGSSTTTQGTTTTTTTTTPTPVTTTPVTSPSAITNTSTTTPTTTEEQAVFAALNAKRSQCGFGNLTYSTELAKAASNHANYLNYVSAQNKTSFASHNEGEMTSNGTIVAYTSATTNLYYSGTYVQNRITTDGSLGAKAQAVAYNASLVTENLSVMTTTTNANTFDSQSAAKNMLSGLLSAPYHMRNLVNPTLTQIGASYQQTNWQTGTNQEYVSTLEMVSATPNTTALATNAQLLNYPCAGVTDAEYQLTDESPSPVPTRDLQTNPIGQPIYILAPSDKTITSVDATVITGNTNVGKMNILTQATDPNGLLKANEAFVLPDSPLKPSTTYQVSYTVHYSTGETAQNNFSFTTRSL